MTSTDTDHPVQPEAIMPLWRRVRITITNDKPVPKVLQDILTKKGLTHEAH